MALFHWKTCGLSFYFFVVGTRNEIKLKGYNKIVAERSAIDYKWMKEWITE